MSIDERRKDFPVDLWEESDIDDQTIEQVWFAGVHADVGGWYDERGLGNISLQWMMGKARANGMLIDSEALKLFVEDAYDQQHEEYKGFWKFRGARRREIADGAAIHESVKQRIDKNMGYSPRNLPANPRYVG